MSKRTRPPRSARSRITSTRAKQPHARTPHPTSGGGVGGRAYWIFGRHAVAAALNNNARKKHRLLATRNAMETLADDAGTPTSWGVSAEAVDRADLDQALDEGAVHQGVALLVDPLADIAIEDVIANSSKALLSNVVVLDQATDPRNIGAVLRSSSAFKADALIIQDRHAPNESGVMAKAASGALETVPIVRVKNLARALWALKDAGYWCYGFDGNADVSLRDVERSQKNVIILGAEGSGLRRLTRETCDQVIGIPIDPTAESLNLSNAAAIALYAFAAPERK